MPLQGNAKHSHFNRQLSRSTEPRALDRMQLHGWKLFCVCVCVFLLACEILNTIHKTQCSDLYSLVYVRPTVSECR